MNDLVTLQDVSHMSGVPYLKLRHFRGRIGFPDPKIKGVNTTPAMYDREEVEEWLEQNNPQKLIYEADTGRKCEDRKQKKQPYENHIKLSPLDLLKQQFIRGEFDPEYRKVFRKINIEFARKRQPKTRIVKVESEWSL